MNNLHVLAAGFALVVLGSRAGVAAEGGGDPFPVGQLAMNTYAEGALATDTGSSLYPPFLPHTRMAAPPDLVLPSSNNEGPVQTAASLPADFTSGTVARTETASVQRWRLQQGPRDYAQSTVRR